MKPCAENPILLTALIAGVGLLLGGPVTAQTFTTLHSFSGNDGARPYANLVISGNTLYGATYMGGSSSNGTVFVVKTDGTGFTNLHSFSSAPNWFPLATNDDGVYPNGLFLLGNTLYGTTQGGGSSARGTIFAVNTDGTGFTNLHSFAALVSHTNSEGAYPRGRLVLKNSTLYGTAEHGGCFANGTVFKINTDGTGFTALHSLGESNIGPSYTNADGANPYAGLILSDNTLYGTAYAGGRFGGGTVFAVNTVGSDFTNLHSFANAPYPNLTNSGGALPYAGLTLSGDTLYGAAHSGGSSGSGTIFKVNTDGTAFTNLHIFAAGSGFYPNVTNSEGAFPVADLVLSGDTLYGVAVGGGESGGGTLFAVKTNGMAFTNLHTFSARSGPLATNNDGAGPVGLIISGYVLYGMTGSGGVSDLGTVFSLSFAPQLTISRIETNLVVAWPTNAVSFDYSGFELQSTTNLVSPVVWTAVSPVPVVVNGHYTVTNSISGTQQFYRLSQ